MSTLTEDSLAILGQEVPLGRVDKALKELWGADNARTKASLMNFAIYSEESSSLEKNTALLAEITQEHACRGLLILSQPGEGAAKPRAWITAHCQLHEGHKSVCSEQISFLLQGGNLDEVRNIVFAHLDSDLPLVCWWQGDLTQSFSERLYSVFDLLFVDSSTWTNPAKAFSTLEEAQSQKTARFRSYDLSWLRSHLFRTALASCFQSAAAIAELQQLQSIEVAHAPGQRIAGLLLVAWMAVRMKCELKREGDRFALVLQDGQIVTVNVHEGTGSEPLQEMTLVTTGGKFTVNRACGGNRICTRVQLGEHVNEESLPADLPDDPALITDQLSRLGGQSLYVQMVPVLRQMLG